MINADTVSSPTIPQYSPLYTCEKWCGGGSFAPNDVITAFEPKVLSAKIVCRDFVNSFISQPRKLRYPLGDLQYHRFDQHLPRNRIQFF